MNYTLEKGSFKSSNGQSEVSYSVYTPKDKEIKAMMQISHGMCEYVGRYEKIIDFLCQNGILVFGNDHIGHGDSVKEKSELGYFSKKDGWKLLIEDVHTMTEIMKEKYPSLPFVLFGHSMGSFIARTYLSFYPNECDGAIICGTSGSLPITPLGILLCKIIKLFKGDHYRSRFVKKIMFGSYCKRIKNSVSEYDWLTSNLEVLKAYAEDEKCHFTFTLSGYIDLMTLLKFVSRKKWADEVSDDVKILLISGEADPVGQYGKGVEQVFHRLCKSGKSADIKLYGGLRHEPHSEDRYMEMFKDVLSHIDNVVEK